MEFGRLPLVLAVAVVCAASSAARPAAAQQASPSPRPAAQASAVPSTADADLVIDADVHIRSIRYDVVPKDAHLRVTGVNSKGGTTVTRTNLPEHPKPGVTYRNVRIQVHSAARFVDPGASPSPVPAPR